MQIGPARPPWRGLRGRAAVDSGGNGAKNSHQVTGGPFLSGERPHQRHLTWLEERAKKLKDLLDMLEGENENAKTEHQV